MELHGRRRVDYSFHWLCSYCCPHFGALPPRSLKSVTSLPDSSSITLNSSLILLSNTIPWYVRSSPNDVKSDPNGFPSFLRQKQILLVLLRKRNGMLNGRVLRRVIHSKTGKQVGENILFNIFTCIWRFSSSTPEHWVLAMRSHGNTRSHLI